MYKESYKYKMQAYRTELRRTFAKMVREHKRYRLSEVIRKAQAKLDRLVEYRGRTKIHVTYIPSTKVIPVRIG